MKMRKLKSTTIADFITYLSVIVVFAVMNALKQGGMLSNATSGMLIPCCCFIVMAVSLNLTVGILGELSLGHAGFMSVGAFTGIITAMSLQNAVSSSLVRLILAVVVGAAFAALVGVLVGIPVLRLRGDYLAIVTLAFGEIIKEIINCLLVGWDEKGLHIALNISGQKSIADLHMLDSGVSIIKGAQGAVGITKLATFPAAFALVLLTLVVTLNLIRSRTGRAVMAIRDNRIAAESVGIPVTQYKLMAFVISAAMAGAAGAMFGLNYSSIQSSKFDFNTSILVLVYVVLGGLGNIRGSILAATVLYILPEALRGFEDYRMLVYAVVLILVMLATNNPTLKNVLAGLSGRWKKSRKGAATR